MQIPVEGVDSSRLRDSFLNSRGRHRKHLAIDIGAPKGTPVVAAADGEIVILRRENRGGISLYQKDKSGKFPRPLTLDFLTTEPWRGTAGRG